MLRLAELVSDESPDGNFLADLCTDLVEQLLNGLRVLLHELLVEKAVVLIEGDELSIDDLRYHAVRFPVRFCLGHRDTPLAFQDLLRHVLSGEPSGRRRARHVQREIPRQLPKLLGVCDEVRLAVHLDQGADGAVEVDVALDQPLVRRPSGSPGRGRETLLAKKLGGPLRVAVCLDQCAFRVHHPCARRVAERLHLDCRHVAHAGGSPEASSGVSGVISEDTGGSSGSNTVDAAISAARSGLTSAWTSGPSASGPLARPSPRPSCIASARTRVTRETA